MSDVEREVIHRQLRTILRRGRYRHMRVRVKSWRKEWGVGG
jgi:hypothetical protein